VNGKPIFSLPGHPTSSLLMFTLLVKPVLVKLGGQRDRSTKTLQATTSNKFFSAKGRRTFITVVVTKDDRGKWIAIQFSTGQSGAITTLANADGYVEVKEDQPFIDVGEEVTVHLF
jgi:molybdopterin biosynthesis enzyme